LPSPGRRFGLAHAGTAWLGAAVAAAILVVAAVGGLAALPGPGGPGTAIPVAAAGNSGSPGGATSTSGIGGSSGSADSTGSAGQPTTAAGSATAASSTVAPGSLPAGTAAPAGATPSLPAASPGGSTTPTSAPTAAPTPAATATDGAPLLAVDITSLPSSISANSTATLAAVTLPGATCKAGVKYHSGKPSSAPGLLKKQVADSAGQVSWTWTIDAGTKAGDSTATVSCSLHGKSASKSKKFVVA
jgi:hypothetical protein